MENKKDCSQRCPERYKEQVALEGFTCDNCFFWDDCENHPDHERIQKEYEEFVKDWEAKHGNISFSCDDDDEFDDRCYDEDQDSLMRIIEKYRDPDEDERFSVYYPLGAKIKELEEQLRQFKAAPEMTDEVMAIITSIENEINEILDDEYHNDSENSETIK